MLTQRTLAFVACVWTLSSCVPRPAEPPAPVPPRATTGVAVPAGAERLEIDPRRTAVTVLVRRAGPLARFGHNHAIVSSQESGFAWVGRDLAGSGFEIHMAVKDFVVDDPSVRAAAGPDFSGEVAGDARQGTYANMLREEVLDAARYPEIVVSASSLAGTSERPTAAARLTLRGVTREIELPIQLRREPGTVAASGTLRLRQTDLGMTPFSVAGGAVQVADEVEIRFEVVAVRR